MFGDSYLDNRSRPIVGGIRQVGGNTFDWTGQLCVQRLAEYFLRSDYLSGETLRNFSLRYLK